MTTALCKSVTAEVADSEKGNSPVLESEFQGCFGVDLHLRDGKTGGLYVTDC